MSGRHRLCYVVSSEMTLAAFLADHIAAAAGSYSVSVAMNTGDERALRNRDIPAELLRAPIERAIAPWQDLRALWVLYRHFCGARFDLVHSVSPKAGLLGMLAAWMARVPRRVHTFTGQVWANKRGWRRELFKSADRLIAVLTTHALVDSPSQRDFLVKEGVLSVAKACVIGKGAICGVDRERFKPDIEVRQRVRRELEVAETAILLLFVGRINRDKGVLDLARAFAHLAVRHRDVFLLLVGPDEQGMLDEIRSSCDDALPRLRHVDFTPEPEFYMAAADILCLPSYREGFGMVVIEAAAAGLPAVASRIYGITDAVADGQTGILHAPGDVAGIESALERLMADPDLRSRMGAAARERALRDFSMERISGELLAFYGRILG
jgi:glycosyltransferase involved in cell wall biosynthesis